MEHENVGSKVDCVGEVLRQGSGVAPVAAMNRIVAIEPREPLLVLLVTMTIAMAFVGGSFGAEAASWRDGSGTLRVVYMHDAQSM